MPVTLVEETPGGVIVSPTEAPGLSVVISDDDAGVSVVLGDDSPGVTVVNQESPTVIVESSSAPGPPGPPGPAGVDGAPGAPGSPGPAGDGGYYTHNQSVASSVWTINHNLGFKPAGIQVFDSGGTEWLGVVEHIDNNTLTVTFTTAFGGFAYIS